MIVWDGVELIQLCIGLGVGALITIVAIIWSLSTGGKK